jgi:hypothetical protein
MLALKAIVRVLLAEKIREFKDEASATFELAANCSEIVTMHKSAVLIPRAPNKWRSGI